MKLLHCVLIILNPLFVFGNVDLKQRLLKNLENEDMENIKDIIDNRLMAETFNIYKNGLKSSGGSNKKNEIKLVVDGIVSLINALKRNVKVEKSDKNVETKDKKKDVGKMVLDDDLVLIYDVKSGRLLGRSRVSGIENFLTDLKGKFEGTINITNNLNTSFTLPYGAPYGQYGYPNGQYGAPHGSSGAPYGQYGAPYGQYGAPHGQYGAPHGSSGAPYGQYGAPYGQYGAPHGQYGAPHGQYEAPRGQYEAPRGQYGAPHSAGDSENYRPHKKYSRDSYKCNNCHERYKI